MLYREYRLIDPEDLNTRLYARYLAVAGAGRVRQTHHFAGRFENTYIDLDDIPDMARVLDVFRAQGGAWLGRGPDSLKAGFWFNAMGPGHVTAPHHHDENDELLSAVYYIRVPENSGALILYNSATPVSVQPEEGKLVMFGPGVMHEVTANNSSELRLSVAMNIGPA
ncbi:MAG: putative 2OG-Fe(II) oxygenase [Pseudomonadota bacterium]